MDADNRIIPVAISDGGFLNPACAEEGEWIAAGPAGPGANFENSPLMPREGDGGARTFRYVISSPDSRRARTYVRYRRAIPMRARLDGLKIPVASN